MITNSVLRIYSDRFLQNLYETVNVTGPILKGRTSTLQPGSVYWATVMVTDSVIGTSPESNPYMFYSLPDIELTGSVIADNSSFARQTVITTDVVNVVEHGLEVTTDPTWTLQRPHVFIGNSATGLDENTTYYYRPWLTDEFGRTYVNESDVDSITTGYSSPSVIIIAMYSPTSTTFSGEIEVVSSTTVTSVVAESNDGLTTITTNLVAGTGKQVFEITNLTPNTKYDFRVRATNTGGTGYSETVTFTTLQQEETEIGTEIINYSISDVNNDVKCVSVVLGEKKGQTFDNHIIYIYDNSEHTGEPVMSYDGEDEDIADTTFSGANLDTDTTYFIISSVERTVGNVTVTYWSEPVKFRTYSLITIGNITTTVNSASFTFTVDGYSTNTEIEYSRNNEIWSRATASNPQGGNVTITGLTPGQTYYLRARVANTDNMYCSYITRTFTTNNTVVGISSITDDNNTVTVNISITQQ